MKKDKLKNAITLKVNEFENRIMDTLKLPSDFSEKFMQLD